MPNLPSGTVTFLFSDIEGSTSLLKRLGDAAYADLLATHRRLMRETFAGFGGQEIDTQGDAFFYSFERARAAVAAAVAVQRAHAAEAWPAGVAVRVRLGLHTGEPAVGDEGYTGLDVVRAARIAASGQGGQVLLSEATRALAANSLPDGVSLRTLGERALKDIERPEPVYELLIEGLPAAAEPATDLAVILPVPTDAQPPAAAPTLGMPDWAAEAARRFLPTNLPGADRQRLEERVLGQIEQAFRAKQEGRRQRPESRARRSADPAPPERAGRARPGSVADEIAKLRALRQAGALSEEQYERAIQRVLDG